MNDVRKFIHRYVNGKLELKFIPKTSPIPEGRSPGRPASPGNKAYYDRIRGKKKGYPAK